MHRFQWPDSVVHEDQQRTTEYGGFTNTGQRGCNRQIIRRASPAMYRTHQYRSGCLPEPEEIGYAFFEVSIPSK